LILQNNVFVSDINAARERRSRFAITGTRFRSVLSHTTYRNICRRGLRLRWRLSPIAADQHTCENQRGGSSCQCEAFHLSNLDMTFDERTPASGCQTKPMAGRTLLLLFLTTC